MKEWKKLDNEDPWSPGNHYIVREQASKILRIIPSTRTFGIMEIESEPDFAYGHVLNMECNGLKIRIIEKQYRDIILKFAEEYESVFHKKVKIVR